MISSESDETLFIKISQLWSNTSVHFFIPKIRLSQCNSIKTGLSMVLDKLLAVNLEGCGTLRYKLTHGRSIAEILAHTAY